MFFITKYFQKKPKFKEELWKISQLLSGVFLRLLQLFLKTFMKKNREKNGLGYPLLFILKQENQQQSTKRVINTNTTKMSGEFPQVGLLLKKV